MRCFSEVGRFSRTKRTPALSATFRNRMGLNDATRLGAKFPLLSLGRKKTPRPAVRNCLRLVLRPSFIRRYALVIMPFPGMTRQILAKIGIALSHREHGVRSARALFLGITRISLETVIRYRLLCL